MAKAFNCPFNHLLISLCQFCKVKFHHDLPASFLPTSQSCANILQQFKKVSKQNIAMYQHEIALTPVKIPLYSIAMNTLVTVISQSRYLL